MEERARVVMYNCYKGDYPEKFRRNSSLSHFEAKIFNFLEPYFSVIAKNS